MADDHIDAQDGLSRRELLKRMAAGSAIAWSAPIISTFNTPAFAGNGGVASPACPRCEVGDFGSIICGGTGPFQQCTCQAVVVDGVATGECFCHEVISCGDPHVIPCSSDADCTEPGWRCTSNGCFPEGGCVPPCGTNHAAAAALDRAGGTSAG